MSFPCPNQYDHRPWPVPDSPWIMAQSWHDLLFAHWPVDIGLMRQLVPEPLELDTFDGKAWVGVVPFRMSGIRPRFCPAVPWLSAFPEFNIRTYVKARDPENPKPGVYFFSLDAANPIAVNVARATYKLPYFHADMAIAEENEIFTYQTTRTHRGAAPAEFKGCYGPTGPVVAAEPGTIDHWFTERYSLYTVSKGKTFRGEIHHNPWPLQPAFLDTECNTMAEASGIKLPDCDPILHFSRRIDVVLWPIKKCDTDHLAR
ncbi:MAG: DUF2071 domain-containing protein [Verrucomicrobiales bacterium]|nr:DUF2071 domain-containing protein [Verrucomicrobiales bacterium]